MVEEATAERHRCESRPTGRLSSFWREVLPERLYDFAQRIGDTVPTASLAT